MKEEQLIKELIKEGESDKLEFKEVMRLDSIAKTICSFLNTNGGRLLVGVKDDGTIIGVNVTEKMEDSINTFLRTKIVPETPFSIIIEEIEEKKIIMVKVGEGSKKPYVFDGSIYYRTGSNTSKASSSQITNLIKNINNDEILWERQIALGVELIDLDNDLIQTTIDESRKNNRGNFLKDSELDFLSHYGLYQNGAFTNACVALFAKEPARFIPQIRVRLKCPTSILD